jgi:methylated-DNA-[protein]-cysteine S-methyltransferase
VTRVPYSIDEWGVGEVWFDRGRLVWHELPRPQAAKAKAVTGTRARARHTPSQGGADFPPPLRSTVPANRTRRGNTSAPIADRFVHRIRAYFGGARESFTDVDLELEGWTTFQIAVLEALRKVPYGEIVSYGELAHLAGYPRAQRAAGTFCARNRFGLVVPCHRVVGADGLGSYGSLGLDYKRRLLALEGVAV